MKRLITFLLLLIITVPAFVGLFQNGYFEMHDDQHIARLYLLNQAIHQGNFFPRWVDTLGFNFGYPLFNFYPPLIYFVAEAFHLIGFSLIWSVKLMLITGFMGAALGMYLFTKAISKSTAVSCIAASLYTFFTYHAVVVYVRGAFAEFFTMAIIPFVFLSIHRLAQKPTIQNALFFAVGFAALILTHPLIAFPSLFFIGSFFIFYFFKKETKKKSFLQFGFLGGLLGLSLSAFFWLPSMLERQYTVLNEVFIGELNNYALHFIYSWQFWYSQWGHGASLEGPVDGLSFQLGKVHIIFFVGALVLAYFYTIRQKHNKKILNTFFLLFGLTLFSLFMTTEYSKPIWQLIPQLAYIQFPWRLLTFVAFFLSATAAFFAYFFEEFFAKDPQKKFFIFLISSILVISPVVVYQKYFHPRVFQTTDAKLTKFDEIAWRVSRSSFDFVPKGVKTKKTPLNTTVVDIAESDIKKDRYEIISGRARVEPVKNIFREKSFRVVAQTPSVFRLNTFNFPGWKAYVDKKEVPIEDQNDYKLITVALVQGVHDIEFKFENTSVRIIGNWISIVSLIFALTFLGFYINARRKSKLIQ